MIIHTIPSSEVLLLTYLVCKLQRQRYKKIQFLLIKSKNFWKKMLKIVSNSIIGKVFGLMKIHQDWLVKFFHAFLLGSLSVSRRRLFFILHHFGQQIRIQLEHGWRGFERIGADFFCFRYLNLNSKNPRYSVQIRFIRVPIVS